MKEIENAEIMYWPPRCAEWAKHDLIYNQMNFSLTPCLGMFKALLASYTLLNPKLYQQVEERYV